MRVEELLEKASNETLDATTLVRLAGDELFVGDDVCRAYIAQIDRRKEAIEAVHDAAAREGRELLASEARDVTRLNTEREQIGRATLHVQSRTMHSYHPPASQRTTQRTTPVEAELSPVLTRDQSLAEWTARRRGERVERARLGAIVAALALGQRDGLSEQERRWLSEGSDSAGGYTVPEPVTSAFIDRVRNAAVVFRAGAQTVPMTSETLSIARIGRPEDAGSPAIAPPTWKAEHDEIVENDILLERVRFRAKTLPMLVKLSVELSEDSVNISEIIERELAAAMALELDRVALLGSGSDPEPRGVRHHAGVGVESFGGTAPTNHDFLIDAIGACWKRNHEPNAQIYNAALAIAIAKFRDTNDGQPLRVPEVVSAVPAFRTNQIPDNGDSPASTTLFVGDFRELLIGIRTSFRLEISREAAGAFRRLQIAVRAYLRADVQVAHVSAFEVLTDIGV